VVAMIMAPVSKTAREYVRSERMRRGITQKQMADHMGIALRTYTDWENGRTKTIKGHLLGLALGYLQAPPDVIARLMVSTPEADITSQEIVNQIETLPPDEQERQRQEATELIDELLSDPKKFGKWLGYGERLREED